MHRVLFYFFLLFKCIWKKKISYNNVAQNVFSEFKFVFAQIFSYIKYKIYVLFFLSVVLHYVSIVSFSCEYCPNKKLDFIQLMHLACHVEAGGKIYGAHLVQCLFSKSTRRSMNFSLSSWLIYVSVSTDTKVLNFLTLETYGIFAWNSVNWFFIW